MSDVGKQVLTIYVLAITASVCTPAHRVRLFTAVQLRVIYHPGEPAAI